MEITVHKKILAIWYSQLSSLTLLAGGKHDTLATGCPCVYSRAALVCGKLVSGAMNIMSTSISDGQVKPCNADNLLYFSRSILRVGHSLWRSEFTRIKIPLISQLNSMEIAVT